MMYIKRIFVLFLLILILGMPLTVSALDSGLTTQPMSEREMSDIAEQNKFTKLSSYTPLAVKCFDVRDDHMVVIGATRSIFHLSAVIAVFDAHGVFQYGFETTQYGEFRVMWSGNEIAYYSIRGSRLYKINEEGKITDVRNVDSSTENSVYVQNVLCAATREVDACTYRMTNGNAYVDVLSGSFRKITRTGGETTTVIYDATSNRRLRFICGLLGLSLISGFIVIGSIFDIKKMVKKKMQN